MALKRIPFFSVVIASYNHGKYIKDAIKSVVNQTFFDWELIVIDDCSRDDSIDVVKKYLDDSRISLIENKKNEGKTRVLKKLLKKSRGNVIVELDSDDFIAPNTLEELALVYDHNLDCGFVYTQCYYCNEKLEPQHLGFSALIPKEKSNLHVNSVVALRTYRKEVYYRTSGYDEKILFAEDIDIVLKMEEVTKLFFIDKPLYYYRILSKSQTHSFNNVKINRSSVALAKLNAYKRRKRIGISNLSRVEVSEVLFWGMINAILARRIRLFLRFKINLFFIYPIFFLDPRFYMLVYKKIKKIKNFKKTKPLLGI